MSEGWLEPVLERDLARVTAPGELWNRIQFPRARASSRSPVWRLAGALATAALVLGVWGVRESRQELELRSSDAVQIQAPVKASSGLGAHVTGGGNPAAEIRYRAELQTACLLCHT